MSRGHKPNIMNEWPCVKFRFKQKENNHNGVDSVWNPIMSLPFCFDLLMRLPWTLLPLTPHWILNEICMADAQQQDVKEEAGGTPGRVKGRGLNRRESWSRLKGRFGWTPPRKSEICEAEKRDRLIREEEAERMICTEIFK